MYDIFIFQYLSCVFDMECMENLRPGGRGVVPPVSVKDRAVVGPVDHV